MQTISRELSNLNFTAIDFEIANEKWDSMCSIGLVKVTNGVIDLEKSYIVRPKELRVTIVNQQLHGLCEEDLVGQPEFTSIWSEISSYFDQRLLVAHNASFDIGVLRQTLKLYDLPQPSFRYLCTQKLAQRVFANLDDYRLDDVAKYLGIDLTHHNALSDARVAAEIAIRSAPKVSQSDLDFGSEELTINISKISSKNRRDRLDDIFGDKKIDRALLKPNLNVDNRDNVFYGKKVVFTGDLESMDRQSAAQRIQEMGADVNVSISKKTNIVVVGRGAGPSKMKKIEELRREGFDIRILYEPEFVSCIQQSKSG